MSNAFVSTARNIATIATDIDSISTAESTAKKLSTARNILDVKIENARGQVAEILLGQTMPLYFVLDHAGTEITPAEQADKLGINVSHVSKMRTVGSVATFIAGQYDEDSTACKMKQEALIDAKNFVTAWWSIETAGTPSAPSIEKVCQDFMSANGDTRLAAVQTIRETMGSVEKFYNIAKGKAVHPDTPVDDDNGDDDAPGETWQNVLHGALVQARHAGATDAQIMGIVRAFSNEV